MPVHSNRFPYAQYVPVDLMDLLFNQEKTFYNSTLADISSPAAVALLYHVMQLTWFL
jgi:hypothetical protein